METSFRDGVATVRFDDGKANALDAGWFTRLDAALDEVEAERTHERGCLSLRHP